MSADFTLLGPEAKVTINTQVFAVVSGRYRITSDKADTSDTQNTTKRNKGGLFEMEADLELNVSSDVSPHAAPLAINEGQTVALAIYPRSASTPYTCAAFRIFSFEGSFAVKGSQPQSIRLSGASDGAYVKGVP